MRDCHVPEDVPKRPSVYCGSFPPLLWQGLQAGEDGHEAQGGADGQGQSQVGRRRAAKGRADEEERGDLAADEAERERDHGEAELEREHLGPDRRSGQGAVEQREGEPDVGAAE